MLKAKGKIWKATGKGGHVIYVSASIVHDSAYPFVPKEEVTVFLDKDAKQIIVSKVKRK